MKGKNPKSMLAMFKKRLLRLEYTRKKADKLFTTDHLRKRDKEQIYQGLFLEAICAFEKFVEDLFLGLLTGSIKPNSTRRTKPKTVFPLRSIAAPIVFSGKYFNCFPYERTKTRAKDFFKDGHPFTAIDTKDEKNLKKFSDIRNYIAHKSDSSKKQFEKMLLDLLHYHQEREKLVLI